MVTASLLPWGLAGIGSYNSASVCCFDRCILQALIILHQAGFAHTDLRWENILWHEGQYVLIDLEFACELNTCPFTPEGIPPASCSTLSPSHHFNNNQTELNSHLQAHAHCLWAKDLKKQTVYVVQ